MFSHNKFLFFLIACMIANPCFAGGILSNVNKSGINTNLINTDPIVFPGYLLDTCNCPKNYYVATCGDIDLNLANINTLVKGKHAIDQNCWNGSYTDMHYLLHVNDDQENNVFFDKEEAFWQSSSCSTSQDDTSQDGKGKLATFRGEIYEACTRSCTCLKCPNGGVTDSETNVTTTNSTTFVENFNTIADCYIRSGSDGKGTFTLQNTSDRCYYSE